MKNNDRARGTSSIYKAIFFALVAVSLVGIAIYNSTMDAAKEQLSTNKSHKVEKVRSSNSPKAGELPKKRREEYFFNMLRDPKTNQIPGGIRARELDFSEDIMATSAKVATESGVNRVEDWKAVGPNNIGGRTRALEIDFRDSNTIIAGGVSGGIWKSTDGGESWDLKSEVSQMSSITCITQDPSNPDIWYFGMGEYFANSANDRGGRAKYRGRGIGRSLDGGETWEILTYENGASLEDHFTDHVYRIVVSPTTGSVYAASLWKGVFRSRDRGETFERIYGDDINTEYYDVDISSEGQVAVYRGKTMNKVYDRYARGVFVSDDDGETFVRASHILDPFDWKRGVVRYAPSNPNKLYLLAGNLVSDWNKMHIMTYENDGQGNWTRTYRDGKYFPKYDGYLGEINSQHGYNMTMAISPVDEDFVLIGFTNVYRFYDGFENIPTEEQLENVDYHWIGGFENPNSTYFYPNHHPDQHALVFDPNDPTVVWNGNDGGIYKTNNVYADRVEWEDKNNGYNVSQFYTVAIHKDANDPRIVGGTQDNGTPSFIYDGNYASDSKDASYADGSYAYIGENYAYTSTQNGRVLRMPLNPNNNYLPSVDYYDGYKLLKTGGHLFIHPFCVDPNDENVMYYPIGDNSILVSKNIETSGTYSYLYNNSYFSDEKALPYTHIISAIEVSTQPEHILYFALSSQTEKPQLYKVENANNPSNKVIDFVNNGSSQFPNGAYIHDIAVNPDNADEIILVMSNYNITGLWRSTNGGRTYSAIEGNLIGTEEANPSLRTASILPLENGNRYYVGTSVGLFSTTKLDGNNTVWVQEGAETIGNTVVEMVTSRKSDGRVAVATHGRGIFVYDGGTTPKHEIMVDGSQGWRLMSPPVEGITIGEWLGDITTQGYPGADYPNGDATVMRFDVEQDAFLAPESADEEAIPGTGYYVYFFNKDKQSGFPKRLTFAGIPHIQDYNITLNDNGWTLFGNPYMNDFPTSALNISGNSVVSSSLSYWDNELGSFRVINDRNDPNQRLESWQGIFIESHGDFANLHFDAGQQDNLITWKESPATYINFNLAGISSYDGSKTLDISTSLYLHAEASEGWDAYDNSKNDPLTPIYATIAFQGISADGDQIIKSQESLPNSIKETVQIPMEISTAYVNSELTLNWPTMENIPDGWQFNLVDIETGDVIDLLNQSEYTFNYTSASSAKAPTDEAAFTKLEIQHLTTVKSEKEPNNNYRFYLEIVPTVDDEVTTNIDEETLPTDVNLAQNYPNPFNPQTNIQFSLPKASKVTIQVFDINGRLVNTLVDDYKAAGNHQVAFDAANLPSGTYLYRLLADGQQFTKKMVLIK